MKKNLFLLLAFIILGATNGNAQVRIGDSGDPTAGAILDLNNTSGYKGGLLVSNVELTVLDDVTNLTLPGSKADLKGLVVYNTNDSFADGAGLYVWDGSNWNKLGAPAVHLEAVTITTLGTGETFCGGVTFKLTKPASWSAEDWAGLSIDNVTATLAGVDYPGTLTFNAVDDSYYYAITAAAVSQAAILTVDGTIGASILTESTKTVTVNLNTDSSFAVGGENCFDIKRSSDTDPDWDQRVQADFTKTYEYGLSGTVGSGFTITSVTWSYTNPEDAVETFTPATFSTTPASNKVTVKYNPDNLIGNTNIDATGIQVVITATIVATSTGACPTAVYTVSRTVTIHDADCCSSVTDAEGNFYYAHQFGDAGCWMTQNLRSKYTMQGSTKQTITAGTNSSNANVALYYYPNAKLTTYNNNPTYGLLYTWAAANIGTSATEASDAFSGIASTRQGICPTGWHLPSDYEWNQLEKEIATNPSPYSNQGSPITWDTSYESVTGWRPSTGQAEDAWGTLMKSQTAVTTATDGTSKSSANGGIDLLMVGYYGDAHESDFGSSTFLWTPNSSASGTAYGRYARLAYTGVSRPAALPKGIYHSVRCARND
ncbi:MAG: fibrobacter succinogenes major paralogous domain-containing protein [Candidatus Symbiothrix sp.]|jgi:uncharacterized protein (TIGR02145 family)|nr:fibrobacter succinogenes major paralogous domain-containing protein [Candidatus Symbiothrix sp.]